MSDVGTFSRRIARLLSKSHEDPDVRKLYLEWAIDHWCAAELKRYLEVVDRCHRGIKSKVAIGYNDLDNKASLIKWGTDYRAFSIEDQNTNFVYVRKSLGVDWARINGLAEAQFVTEEFSIYRYWKSPSRRWEDHEISLRALLKSKGTTYNDLRDRAWIASRSLFELGAEHGMMCERYHSFTHALFNLDMLDRELKEVTAVAQLKETA